MADNGFQVFSHGHQDLILAVSYDFYGTRMATASADHTVKIWDRHAETGQWNVFDSWIAHSAEVTDVRWNGPFVGTHLGTVGEDGLLRIWQEDVNAAPHSGLRFRKILERVPACAIPYMCLDFKNIGTETYLAAITRDGFLEVLEPEDSDNLSTWRVMWSDYLCKTPSRTDETAFRLCWHKEKIPAWPAVLAGLDRKSLGLAVATGTSVKVFRTDKDRKFYTAATLDGARDLVRDVSWANGSMRGFDTLATASRDGCIRVYELHTFAGASLPVSAAPSMADFKGSRPPTPSTRAARSGIGAGLAGGVRGRRDENAGGPGAVRQESKMVAEMEAHGLAPWRVSWAPMAEVLLSTGDDGTSRMWRRAGNGKWTEVAEISAVTNDEGGPEG